MKILSTPQTREADAFTIANEPIKSIDLMERASRAFVSCFNTLYPQGYLSDRAITVFCGQGNNGGDGLAISRLLLQQGLKVTPYVVNIKPEGSQDFEVNKKRLEAITTLNRMTTPDEFPSLSPTTIIIDALFGSGITRPVEGTYAKIISAMNLTGCTIVSVDIASGLFADSLQEGGAIITPRHTISFQLPRLAFMMPQAHPYVGEWHIADIGLSSEFITSLNTDHFTIESDVASAWLRTRQKFDHKGTFGHGLLMGGSYGKIGAMVLASQAFMASGAGLLTSYIPQCGYEILQSTVPEAMTLTGSNINELEGVPTNKEYDAVGIGPGLGVSDITVSTLEAILTHPPGPLVIDADALNILAMNRHLLELLPENSILTPHIKEFERLVGKSDNDWDQLDNARSFAKKYKVIILLKGAHSAVIVPDNTVYFNTTGNPGMATAGSGDVLTGVITSLRAQGYPAVRAAALGMFLHGLAGDLAETAIGQEALTASSIINSLSQAFLRLKG